MRLITFVKEFLVLFLLLLTFTSSIPDKVCKGDVILDSSNIDRFKNCTKINGSLYIEKFTFPGGKSIPKMDPSKLEVFSTVREITGYFYIAASHPNFTDLRYFRNLEIIRGNLHREAVHIKWTSLKSLGLRSLQRISGEIYIGENNNLCFTQGINWRKLLSSLGNSSMYKPHIILENNSHKYACLADKMVCHEECSKEDGCWGPSVDECLSCKEFSLDGTCLDSCSYPGIYQSGDHTCAKCHEECDGNCTGPGPGNCTKCPSMTYEMNGDCVQCNETCVGGCTGSGDFFGSGGCDKVMVRNNNRKQDGARGRLIKTDEPCKEGYFSELVNVTEHTKSWKSFICTDKCPEDKPRIRQGQGGLYCSADPVEKISVSAIFGGVFGCAFLISIFVAVFGYQSWHRAKSRKNTVKMTMPLKEIVCQEESDPLNTSHVDSNRAQLRMDDKAELRNEGIPDAMCATDERNSGGSPEPQFMAAKLHIFQLENDMWSITKCLDNKKWLEVGLNLEIPHKRLDELKLQNDIVNDVRSFEMLRTWRERNPNCTLQDLFDALKQLGMESSIENVKRIDFSKHMTQM